MNIKIREATISDADAACTVLRRSIIECCVEDHKNLPDILSVWLQNKTPQNIASLFASIENISIVAIMNENIVGIGMITPKGELALCYILPEVRFSGVGRSLLHAMEAQALKLGLGEIYLSSTATAKCFYERNGFISNGPPIEIFGIQSFPFIKPISKDTELMRTTNEYVQNIEGIRNFFYISDRIGTSGQPTKEQFKFIGESGYEVIINLAVLSSLEALPDEQKIVNECGLEYIHIPVIWDSPTQNDLIKFFEVMKLAIKKKVFVHCIANKRVSAFLYLYHVCIEKWDVDLALRNMHQIWVPNDVWQNFINEMTECYHQVM